MKFSILHPTYGRPQQAEAAMKAWLSNCHDRGSLEYILSVDVADRRNLKTYKRLSKENGIQLLVSNNKSAIQAINRSAEKSTGDVIVQIADDFNEPPLHWDKLLLEALEGKEDFVVKTQDGIQKTIITLPIMDRKFYNRFGYVYERGYVHLFSDTELTAVGEMLGKVINLDIYIPHNHYTTGKSKKDAVNVKNNRSWEQGEKLFNQRLLTNFGLKDEEIVKPYSEIQWH